MILEANDKVLDHLGESIFMYRGGTNAKSGMQSTLETSSIIVVDGVANQKKRYREPSLTNPALFQRDRFLCAYCGGVFRNHELTRDHIHPTSKGGKDVWMNVVSSCKECNAQKSDTLPGAMLGKDSCGRQILGPQGTGRFDPLFVPYVPCRAEHFIMKNRTIKADQMQFLLERVHNKKSRIFEYAHDLFPDMKLQEAH
jgi:hypothetical protein